MAAWVDEVGMRNMIQSMRFNYSTDKELAEYLDISPQYLHDILTGNRKVGIKAANKLGYRPEQVYFSLKE